MEFANVCEWFFYDNRTKQFHIVEYLGCYLDANLNGESMAMKPFNTKLQSLYKQNATLNPKLCRLLCNSLIQPHFDYVYISSYPLVSKKIRKKTQFTQNKCIRFC